MSYRKMRIITAVIVLVMTSSSSAAKRTSTKTKLDIRVVRSPQHTDATSAYLLSSHQARHEEGHSVEEPAEQHHHKVSLVTEEQYEALLKQAQKALQGYDLTKLTAAAQYQSEAAHYQPEAVHEVVPEQKAPAVVFKPEVQIKYVYTDTPTSVAYNSAPAVYGAPTHTHATATHTSHTSTTYDHSTDDHDDYFSKHKFGYRVHDPHTGAAFGHSEVSEGHVTRGHYHVLLPDGRLQNVKYVADPSGYHATVTYDTYKHY